METTKARFLIDTNTLITPYKKYYPFDLAPSFWRFMESKLKDGSIALIDKVYDELIVGGDELTDWLLGISPINLVRYKNPDIIKKYGEILSYIQVCGLYKTKALTEWSDNRIADPWIIASAGVLGYTVTTFEEPNGNLSKSSPCSRAKIPEICKVFDVECTDLFDMMRTLSFNIF